VIDVPELGDAHHATWSLLMQLAEKPPAPWTLVGAHMVLLHLWAHGSDIQRATRDADILVNSRAVANGTERFSRHLLNSGFDLPNVSPDGIGHRFERGDLRIDVLAPDRIGERANTTTIRPYRTIRVPGGLGALNRTVRHEVRSRRVAGHVFAPDLLGAIVATVRAIDVDDAPDDKQVDAALLVGVVDDPRPLEDEITTAERRHLRRHHYFADPGNAVWRAVRRPDLAASIYARIAGL
jgi:hypothetical protein